jgi:hypothetical protein
MKHKATLVILLMIAIGCKKNSGDNNITLDGALTGCPLNNSCTYNYYNNADFNLAVQPPIAGKNRVFVYKAINNNLCAATTSLYFKTASGNSSFDITTDQIAAGQVVGYGFNCACCDVLANVKPIGGEIKGKSTDGSHWLINASVIIGTAVDKPIDTIKVNQTFIVTSLK